MFSRASFIPLLLVLIPGAGCSPRPDRAAQDTGEPNTTLARDKSAQREFPEFAVLSHKGEIELGRMAERKARHPEVRKFAALIVRDHRDALDDLHETTGLADETQVELSDKKEIQRISRLPGEEFDREFIRVMIKSHEEALARFTREAEQPIGTSGGADRDERTIPGYARETLPALRHHLSIARELSTKIGS